MKLHWATFLFTTAAGVCLGGAISAVAGTITPFITVTLGLILMGIGGYILHREGLWRRIYGRRNHEQGD